MNTVNIIKSISHKFISTPFIIAAAFNFTQANPPTPENTINAYTQHINKAGNVLAYKNCADQIIVLKSGNSFTKSNPEIEKEPNVLVIPLEDVVTIAGTDDTITSKYTTKDNKLTIDKAKNLSIDITSITNYATNATKEQSDKWIEYFTTHFKKNFAKKTTQSNPERILPNHQTNNNISNNKQ